VKHLLILAALTVVVAPAALAQSDEYNKIEFFGGYSYTHFDNLTGDTGNAAIDDVLGGRSSLQGFNLALNYNFHKYFGAKVDYSLHLREDNFSRPQGSGTIDTSLQNFLGGVQLKNNLKDGPRFKPFAHALFGVAVQKLDLDSPQLPAIFGISDFHANETSFAMAFGGGIDIKLNDRLDVRVIQADLNIVQRGDQQLGTVLVPTPFQTVGQPFILPGKGQDNLRLSIGIVIH
jgi:opacity protein-like surface antigen